MNVQFTRNTSDPRTVNKVFTQATPQIRTGTFKTPFNLRTPTLIIDNSNLSNPTVLFAPALPNYVRISKDNSPDANTYWYYYFINDIRFVTNTLVEFDLELDVLKTFATEIGNLTAMVERNEYEYDPLIEDKLRPLYGRKISSVLPLRKLSNCVSFNMEGTWDGSPSDDEGNTIALTVFVKNDQLAEISNYLKTNYPNDFTSSFVVDNIHKLIANDIPNPFRVEDQEALYRDPINSFRVNPSMLITYLVDERNFMRIAREIVDDDTLYSSFVSAVSIPLPLSAFGDPRWKAPVYIGSKKISNPDGTVGGIPDMPVSNYGQMSRFIMLNDHEFSAPASFIDLEPYTTYEFYIPYVGLVPIPATSILGRRILLYYQIDLTSGEATAYLTDGYDGNVPIFSAPCKIGGKVSISSTNERENQNARTASALNTAIGLVSSMVGIAGGIATGNPIAVGGGAILGARAISSAISTNLNIMDRSQTSLNTNFAGYYTRQRAYLRKTFTRALQTTRNGLPEFAHNYGLPLNQPKLLSTLHGYTLVSAVHLDGFNAPKPIKDEIETLLKTGVIL